MIKFMYGDNMNNRAFTLIELVAIIVVLLAIFIFAFPSFSNMIKSDSDKQYTKMVDDLCTAGKTYMYANMDEYPELSIANSVFELKISKLIIYGNVDKDIINPKTEKKINNDILEYTVNSDLTLECEYKEGE